MQLRKVLAVVLAICMMLSLLSACGGSPSSSAPDTQSGGSSPASGQTEFEVGGAGTSTYVYSFMVAASEIINSSTDYFLNVQSTSGSNANYVLMKNGDVQIATGMAFFDKLAHDGAAPFTEPYERVRTMFMASEIFAHFLVPVKSDAQCLSDFGGYKVGVGAAGSPTSNFMGIVFDKLGVNVELIYSSADEMVEMYKDGRLDAVAYIAGSPNSNFLDMISAVESRFVPLSDAEAETLSEISTIDYMTSDMYSNIPEGQQVTTLKDYSTITVSADMSEQACYDITKIIMENWDGFAETLSAAASIKPEMINDAFLYVHPGAQKYYEEIGIQLKDSLIAPNQGG